jgi:hypothetical protein
MQTYVERGLEAGPDFRRQTGRNVTHPRNAVLALQASVGNAAVAQLLRLPGSFSSTSSPRPLTPIAVQRCGDMSSGSDQCSCCGGEETAEGGAKAAEDPAVPFANQSASP